jgi:hypothetical protein
MERMTHHEDHEDYEGKKKISINRFPNFVAFVPFVVKLSVQKKLL